MEKFNKSLWSIFLFLCSTYYSLHSRLTGGKRQTLILSGKPRTVFQNNNYSNSNNDDNDDDNATFLLKPLLEKQGCLFPRRSPEKSSQVSLDYIRSQTYPRPIPMSRGWDYAHLLRPQPGPPISAGRDIEPRVYKLHAKYEGLVGVGTQSQTRRGHFKRRINGRKTAAMSTAANTIYLALFCYCQCLARHWEEEWKKLDI